MDTADGQAVQRLFRLPISDHVVALRHPTGAEDLLLLEAPRDDTELALALADQLVQPIGGATVDWRQLTVSDLEALILRLRQAVIGDRVRADIACQSTGCGRRIDISFGIDHYLAHRKPANPGVRSGWSVGPDEEPGWFRLSEVRKRSSRLASSAEPPVGDSNAPEAVDDSAGAVAFRLPTIVDRLAVAGGKKGADELARRCIRPAGVPLRLRRLVEAAMETMAPSLSGDLQGTCPECGAQVVVYFDALQFCLRELRDRAAFIYQDIDLLARRYHWSETDILSMPHVRRTNYVELARQEAS
jgi:hypothetical protein